VKQQEKHPPSKANSTTKDINTCIEEEISNNEFQKTTVKIINDLKEETQKLVLELKEDMSWAPLAHPCNPSYSGGRDQKDRGSKPSQASISVRPYLKKPFTKIIGLIEWPK
jgi:hypothetical protein